MSFSGMTGLCYDDSMLESYEIRIRKDALKFAASHMTVFPDGTKESLHGHNYVPSLTVRVRDASFESTIPFSRLKAGMKKIALAWDEKVLVATRNPFYEQIRLGGEEFEFRLCGKRYVLPVDEVVRLETDNISCETLARTYFDLLEAELGTELHADNILSVAVYIEETPGQGAAFERVTSS
jgi:6-pyruvoyltetrahydropterin/6-carboxytetrahydropterin synthase